LVALVVAGAAPAAERRAEASASAFGVRVVSPAGGATGAAVSAPPDASGGGSFAYGDGAISAGSLATGAHAEATRSAAAEASASVGAVSIFDGEITVGSVNLRAAATASAKTAGGSLAGSNVSGLTVLGETIAAVANARVPLGDWGYLVVLEQAVVPADAPGNGRKVFVSGLHVHLSAEHGGLPAGTDITVGYAEASASARTPPPPPPDSDPTPGEPGSGSGNGSGNDGSGGSGSGGQQPSHDPEPQPPGANPTPPPIVQNPPDDVRPNLTSGGYVFPVYGPDASFANDFQAARATTGWHHGNDIFAPLGTPVLAVSDGELFLVGLNAIGGNRLWLRDKAGNEFYYAHLSAYTPLAYEGARVKAGDVIGFVGTTGDALGTPPHLHFEIHPRGLLWVGYDGVVNPYAYLLAWRRLDDLAFDLFRPPSGQAPEAGAILLQADDISAASGLEPGALARALESPDLFGEASPAESSSPGFVEPGL
jgi:murein DD-endopeptidase MepM/ murein hydrolase activator NlpD